LLNGAKLLQDKFFELLGSDLTKANGLNPFWHTGYPCSQVNVDPEDLLRKKPWKRMWEVAYGAGNGKGVDGKGRTSQRWEDHFEGFISPGNGGHMWKTGGTGGFS
jgi:hypothetical protein